MKKIVLLILQIVILINYGYSQNIIVDSINDWEKQGLEGKVKSKMTEFYEQDSIGNLVISRREEVRFNESGRCTYRKFYGSDFYKYDDMGRIIEQKSYEEDGRLSSDLTFAYDDQSYSMATRGIEDKKFNYSTTTFDARGKITQEKAYDLNRFGSESRYDVQGNLIEEVSYDANGRMFNKYTCQYDTTGKLIEKVFYNADGSMRSKYTYGYATNGKLIEQISYNADGSSIYKQTFKYDDRGKLIEENTLDNNGNLLRASISKYKVLGCDKVEKIYRENGKIDKIKSEIKLNENGDEVEINITGELNTSVPVQIINKYNDRGKLIEQKGFRKDGILLSWKTYEYNDKDELIEFKFGDKRRQEKRTFKYDDKGNKIELEKTFSDFDGRIETKFNFIYFYSKSDEDKITTASMLQIKPAEEKRFKYDSKGKLIEKVFYNADSSVKSKYTYRYASNGNLIEQNKFSKDGILLERNTYKYNDKDELIETLSATNMNESSREEEKQTFKYDDRGNCIEQNWFNADGILNSTETTEYDDKNNTIKVSNYSGGSLDYYEQNKYNTKGQIIAKSKYVEIVLGDTDMQAKQEDQGTLVEETGAINWVYDEEGNCVEETRSGDYIDGGIVKIVWKYDYYPIK